MNKIFLIFAIIFAASISFQAEAQNKKVTGEWKYEVAQAPYGYNKGVISFAEQKKELSGKVKFNSGYSVDLTNISYKEGVLKAEVFIEGENVKLASAIKGDEMTGTVDSSMGKMNLKAKKVPFSEEKIK